MKKTYQLKVEDKNRERLVETYKNEIRKYIKREKKKKLPVGADFWTMECKFGRGEEPVKSINFVDIMKHIDKAVRKDSDSFYMEIITHPGQIEKREKRERE